MFVEYGGGKDGIKEYLEEGKKQGRELSRDELDERVILEGDLELCEKICNFRETDGERYAHITLSFTEDEVRLNPDLLKSVVQDYKRFALGNGAYTEDELYVYAEAHLPRTKSEFKFNAETKQYEKVDRLIHVHIVIPTTNLITGERAAPFEAMNYCFGEEHRVIDYADAIKEEINDKYGFTSPNSPEHRRDSFGGTADILSRIKGDNFAERKYKNHDTLKMLRNAMLDRGVESEAAFKAMLTNLGYVFDYGHSRKDGDYLKIKPIGADDSVKWIRLNDDQFRPAFLNLSIAQKLEAYQVKAIDKWNAEAPARKLDRDKLLANWNTRARAEKYFSYGCKLHKEYLAATPENKIILLDKLEAKFYGKAEAEHSRINDAVAHEYFDKLINDGASYELDTDGQAHRIKIENYSSAKLNNTFLRTGDQLRKAEEKGCQIIDDPESVIKALTANESVFTEAKLQTYLLKNTADADQYDAAMRAVLSHPDLVVQPVEEGLQFTSQEIVDIEKSLVARTTRMASSLTPSRTEINATLSEPAYMAEETRRNAASVLQTPAMMKVQATLGKRAQTAFRTLLNLATIPSISNLLTMSGIKSQVQSPGIPPEKIQSIANSKPFNPGQRKAFDLLCSNKQIAVVNGAAGTGKSFVLAAMRQAYEDAGFKVYGAILQGKTAQDLERDSGIKSQTIAKTLWQLNQGKMTLDSKSVIIVDEAGMVGSKDVERLLAHVEKAGARIRLVGDARQLAAVSYGNAFVEVSSRCEVAALTQIMRQREAWMLGASEKFAAHNIDGLKDYADRGHVHLADTSKDAQIAIVAAWTKHRFREPKTYTEQDGKAKAEDMSSIVLAHTNAERISLNALMRTQLKTEGKLQDEIGVQTSHGIIKLAVGDQVAFLASDNKKGVKNGTAGSVISIKDGVVTIALEGGKSTEIYADGHDTEKGNELDHGFCVTVHKSQGATVGSAFVLANSSMSLENVYVAMTRHKHDAHIFGSQEQFKDLDAMIKGLDKSGNKAFSGNGAAWQSADRPTDSVIGQILAEINAAKTIKQAAQSAHYQEILRNLDLKRMLDFVSKSHGVDISKYPLVLDDKGKQCIKVGGKTMSAATFLTNILHLDYKSQAEPILKQCYQEQLANVYSLPRFEKEQIINQDIVQEFAEFVKQRKIALQEEKEKLNDEKRGAKVELDKLTVTVTEKQAATRLSKLAFFGYISLSGLWIKFHDKLLS